MKKCILTMAPTLFFILLMQLIATTCNGVSPPKFSAVLIFGDSTVDTGNNNYIDTAFRANHTPYGQDFPDHIATGRFSNGKLVPDFLATKLGIKETAPPFLDPNLPDYELLTGVNFASAGSGYDELTTAATGAIPLSKQPQYLKSYIERLNIIVGEDKARSIINDSLVVISAGPNDFIFNFYDIPTRRLHFDTDAYQDFVQYRLQIFVQELYNLGCRTMIISGLPPIGCLPIQMSAKLKPPYLRTCLHHQNRDAQSYNQKLVNLLPQLQVSLPGTRLIYSDVYEPLNNLITNPQKYGFVETSIGCCGTGTVEAGGFCSPNTPVCANHSQYVFWDTIHPSETTYRYVAEYLENEILAQLSDIGSH
ncbi:GDSL esterase/lipase At2g30310 [Cornus florida]|uniref:GDSL esterase/lipase At2g30310 n=1 Tax=Cornus florida TaxID=4283 RepID=UPI002899E576|nr:GDSL esterase/lipase At2g30310 [Cornus florida]